MLAVLSCRGLPSPSASEFSFIIERLQAADFLADESVLAAAAEQLAGSILHRLLEQPQQHGDQLAENVDAHIPCEVCSCDTSA